MSTTTKPSMRRTVQLVTSVLVALALMTVFLHGCRPSSSTVLDAAKVRDKLYIWTHPAGSHNGYYLAPHTHVKSRMTPVEGALYLGVPNIYFIQYKADSPPPSEFRKNAIAFEPMKEVIWSLTGVGGQTSPEARDSVLAIAADFPNVIGFILDDFIYWGKMRAHEKLPHWVADNEVDFPVTLTLIPPEPVDCDKIELVQTTWPTGDYRTKDFTVSVVESGQERQITQGSIPNKPGAVAEVALSGKSVERITIIITSTHDTDKAKSCGLQEVRIWHQGKQLSTAESWTAEASSTYPTWAHSPGFVYLTEWPPKPSHEDKDDLAPVGASMSPGELLALRELTVVNGKRLPIICGIYENQISPRVMPHLEHVDKVALWTWVAEDLVDLESNFEQLEELMGAKPIILGCYMYDYGGTRVMPVEYMQRQCELGLKWLKEGRIEGMIFLASNICDQRLEAVEWTRDWIAEVGNDPL